MLLDPLQLTIIFIASLSVGMIIVATKGWHGGLTFDSTDGVQKLHDVPTPRIGGVVLVVGMLVAVALLPDARLLMVPMLMAGMPAFVAGAWEDLTKHGGVVSRLAATILSGLLVCLFTGTWLTRVDLPVVDMVFASPYMAVPVTAVALAGLANALNMLDGFNGLAGGVSCIILLTLASIAALAGDKMLALVCVILATVTLGFLVINFPSGRLFLGDGGAYLLGFLIGWCCVLLVERKSEAVSPWACILACGYPVLEMFFSMWRKAKRDRSHMSRPDRLHLHHLLHQRLVRRLFPSATGVMQNALTAPFGWCFTLLMCLGAVLFYDSTPTLMCVFFGSALFYGGVYARLA